MNAPADKTMMIVVGTDFSEHALKAADVAAALAIANHASLTLVHVHQTIVVHELSELAAEAAQAARQALQGEAARLRKVGIEVGCEMIDGSAGRALLDAAERYEADLLVLGSKSRKSISERWLLGDVAEHVAEHAMVPTLIVRDAAPLLNWATKLKPLRILIGENLREPSDNPLLWVKSLAGIAPAHVTVAYVAWPYDEALRYGFPLPSSYLDTSPELMELLKRDLKHRVQQLAGDLAVETVVNESWGSADISLARLVKEDKVDLLVVGARQHRRLSRFLEHSVSRAAIHDTSANLAIVPCKAAPACERPISKFERVLVATDFSADSNRAIPIAYSMVAPGGVVCLAHVCNKDEAGPHDAETRLQALVPTESRSMGIRSEVAAMVDEKASNGILQLANRFGADAVCMASHTHSELGDAFARSPSRDLLRAIRVPVLMVHAEGN